MRSSKMIYWKYTCHVEIFEVRLAAMLTILKGASGEIKQRYQIIGRNTDCFKNKNYQTGVQGKKQRIAQY